MSGLERELRERLRRKQPPDGFEQRLAARIAEARRSRARWHWIRAGIAACVFLSVGTAYWQRVRAGERAKSELLRALQITSEELRSVERVAAKTLNTQER